MSKIKLTQAKIDEAQAVLEAIINELNLHGIELYRIGTHELVSLDEEYALQKMSFTNLYDAYLHLLHEAAGTTPPPQAGIEVNNHE